MCPKKQQTSDNLIVKEYRFIIEIFDTFNFSGILRRYLIHLRWLETKKLKISTPDNILFLYLIIIKLCTLKQLENIHQKLKLIFS